MDADTARTLLLALPHVTETMQWGANLVFWVGDKAIGGKMLALIDLDERGGPVISFAAGQEHAAELCEMEGFRPAPYFARLHWIAADRWDALVRRDWQQEFSNAHAIVSAKLTARARQVLELPQQERERLVAERRKLAASAGKKKAAEKSSA